VTAPNPLAPREPIPDQPPPGSPFGSSPPPSGEQVFFTQASTVSVRRLSGLERAALIALGLAAIALSLVIVLPLAILGLALILGLLLFLWLRAKLRSLLGPRSAPTPDDLRQNVRVRQPRTDTPDAP
jgi:hypothetical protein